MSSRHDKLASGRSGRSELQAEASPQRCQIDCLVVGDGDWMLHNRTEDVRLESKLQVDLAQGQF